MVGRGRVLQGREVPDSHGDRRAGSSRSAALDVDGDAEVPREETDRPW
ncbi:hypothetical protein FM103_04210 [Corynebacterium xerosis]|nr:hypothetical protein FM103_04210 [Corynebacterium xerosis]